jgi:hypothetical protein
VARLLTGVAILGLVVALVVFTGGTASRAAAASVAQVARAFAARGIHLAPQPAQPPSFTHLTGRETGGPLLDVEIYHRGAGHGAFYAIAVSNEVNSSHPLGQRPPELVSASRGNVTVTWTTHGTWRAEAHRIRAVLRRLSTLKGTPVSVSCETLHDLGTKPCRA